MGKGFYLVSGDRIIGCADTLNAAQAKLLDTLQSGPQREIYICELLPREYAHWETLA